MRQPIGLMLRFMVLPDGESFGAATMGALLSGDLVGAELEILLHAIPRTAVCWNSRVVRRSDMMKCMQNKLKMLEWASSWY